MQTLTHPTGWAVAGEKPAASETLQNNDSSPLMNGKLSLVKTWDLQLLLLQAKIISMEGLIYNISITDSMT